MRRAGGYLALLGSIATAKMALADSFTPDLSGYPTRSEVQSMVPGAAAITPPAAALDGAQGAATEYARADHTHAVRVQRIVMTTDASGLVTWTFARPIVCAAGKVPPVTYMVEDTGSPVVVQVTSRAFTTDGVNDTHTSVTVKAQRSRALPATLVTLGTLANFDVFGIAAGGVKVNLFAATPTQ